MIIINAVEGKKICLGRIGENEARAVRFDVSRELAEFPGCSFTVLNMRPSDPDAYPVNGQFISVEGGALLWTLQSGDLIEDGLGECELKATLGSQILKDTIWTTEILRALDGNGEPPEPWESWQQEVEENAQRAEDAAEDSEAWAVGERGGVPVEEDDPTYHNNAEYWAGQAQETLASKADKRDTVLETTLSRGRKSTSAKGTASIAFGTDVVASGSNSTAVGSNTKATGSYSSASGLATEASGSSSHAEGSSTMATGQGSHAEGYNTSASGQYSHSENTYTTARGIYSHAEGSHTTASHKSQHVFGEYNEEDNPSGPAANRGTFIEIVGNGTASNAKSNARTLDWDGNERLKGDLYVGANSDGTGGTKVAKITDIPEPVDISGKADKVSGGTADNFAGLDENGNLKDSGKAASDFVAAEDFRADAMPMSASDPTKVSAALTDVKSQIDGKAPLIFDTVQNVPIASVSDATAHPVKSLIIGIEPKQAGSGDPYPAGGGKNKLNIDTVTWGKSINASGQIVNADNFGYSAQIPVEEGETYTFGFTSDIATSSVRRIHGWDANGDWVDQLANDTTTAKGRFSFSATIPNGVKFITVNIRNTDLECQVEKGTATAYAPYENNRPITGWDAVVLSQSGANLISTASNKWEEGGINSSGQNASADDQKRTIGFFPVKGGATMKISGIPAQSPASNVRVFCYEEDGTFIDYYNYRETYTVPAKATKMRVRTPKNLDISALQLQYDTVTPYEAYTGQTNTADLPSTVYGARFDWVNGKAYVTHAIKDMGDMSWAKTTATPPSFSSDSITDRARGVCFICSCYKPASSTGQSAVQDMEIGGNLNSITMYVRDSTYSDAIAFKTSVTGQKICYELATPIEIPLSSLDTISTVAGQQNNLWADCGDIVELTYGCDTKGYIDKQIATLQALILENT